MEKSFKYKLDFYYQQAIIYLITLIVYAGLRGSIVEDQFLLVFRDPILYIIIFFVVASFAVLIINKIRDKRLIFKDDAMVFYNKFHQRAIKFDDIEWMYIGQDRSVQTAGKTKVIVFKIKNRMRLFKIRLGRYDHQKELLSLIHELEKKIPQRKKRFSKLRDMEN